MFLNPLLNILNFLEWEQCLIFYTTEYPAHHIVNMQKYQLKALLVYIVGPQAHFFMLPKKL